MLLRLARDCVNSYVLHRQHLASTSRGNDVVAVAQDIGPIRATPSVTSYLSLWCRLAGSVRKQFDEALYQRRSLVRVPALHGRLYIIPADRFSAYFQVSASMLGAALRDLDHLFPTIYATTGAPIFGAELAQRVLEVISTCGPSTIDELSEWLPILNSPIREDQDRSGVAHTRCGARLIPALCAQGLLIRAQTVGGWRSEHYRYAPISSWLPDVDLWAISPEAALQDVVLHYVAAYGPVSVGDIMHWLGGVPRQKIVAALMELGGRFVRLQIEDSPGEYFLLEEHMEPLLAHQVQEYSVSLLPAHDSLLMAYSDPGRWLDLPYQGRLFDRAGEALGTVWLDGIIVGTWGMQAKESKISVRFFEALDPNGLARVGEEARQLGRFMEFDTLDLELKTYAEEEMDEEDTFLLRSTMAGTAP